MGACASGICGGGGGGKSGYGGTLAQKCIIPNNKGMKPESQYKVQRQTLGEGAFGSVVKVNSKVGSGQTLAMKSIKKAGIDDVAAFQNEIDIQLELDHPNVVRLFEVFEDARNVYLVMDICNGGEMFDLISTQPDGFGEADVALLLRQMLRAIYYMHGKCIAHRDLKPENFLLLNKYDGANGSLKENTLKLIDFGISKRFKKGQKMTDVCGTPYYVAPEILATKVEYDETVDIWACGVIMYILHSGEPPFGGDTDDQIFRAIKRANLQFQSDAWKIVSPEAKEFIRAMCNPNISKRLTAEQACSHPWLESKKELTKRTQDQASQFSRSLAKFSRGSDFKKIALQFIAHRLSDKNIDKIRKQFQDMDANGDGKLTLLEIQTAFANADIGNVEDIKSHFQKVDVDSSDSIDYTEFIAAMMEQNEVVKEDVCWEAFRVFDRDGDGKISKEELQQVLSDKQVQTSHSGDVTKVAEMIQQADTDGDGQLDFQEFMAMLKQ